MANQYYNPGSEIELACIIRNRSLWSTEVQWLKDEEPVDLHHRPLVRYGTNFHSICVIYQPSIYHRSEIFIGFTTWHILYYYY